MDDITISKLIPVILLFVLGVLESIGGLYFEDKRTKNDFTIELLSLVTLPTLIQPSIFLLVLWGMSSFYPGLEDYLVSVSIWWHILAFLILDDMTQYWWHRLSHVSRRMWKLHRPHHVVEEMGVLVTYRNAILYYALMPGIWFSALLVYLGMGYIYLFYLPIKLVVILLAHSETKWDRFLYRYKILSPLAWIVERSISTPSTHFAHHGLTAEDGVSHPNGNFGNLLFIWDIIFGTAKITRKYPTKFGAWNQIKEPWYVQLFFPILRSKDEKSELHSIRTNHDYDPSKDYQSFSK
ncbi:MAG: sterol desaturase/sphingolipid hydroxylase (fatty acid hydroxylase superfamily) [Saprospiraceae bacterium]|jgi:sterol desaturase/sphingolipid hydroxylase (fatty acid hydroxylase superfamily)|tara:strand:- start:579 stop:1460 length:882 start_codon:yes stop_codon:yes gene_type:complete